MKPPITLLVMIALLSTLSGCDSLTGKLGRSGAAKLIEGSDQFKLPLTVPLPSSFPGYCERDGGNFVQDARELGLVTFKTVGQGLVECHLDLTEAGQKSSSEWKHAKQFIYGETWQVPIANKELIEVTGIIGGDKDIAVAEYTWKYVPNSFGKKLKKTKIDVEIQRNKETFRKYDDGWRIDK